MQLAKVLTAKHGVRVTFVNIKYNHDRIQHSTHLTSSKPVSSSTAPNIVQAAHPQQDTGKLQFLWVENGLPPDFDYTDLTLSRLRELHLATYNMK
eukprot:c43878_g1_i1 orf=3-287(+)